MKKRLIRLTNIDEVLDYDKKLVILEKGDIVSPTVYDYIRENNFKIVSQDSNCSTKKEKCNYEETNRKNLTEENIIFAVKYIESNYGITDKIIIQKIISKIYEKMR